MASDDKLLNPPIVIDLTRSLNFGGHGVLREISAKQQPTGAWLVEVKPFVCEEGFGWDYIRGRSSARAIADVSVERLVPIRVERPGTGKHVRRAVLYLPRNAGDVADWIRNTDFGVMVKIWLILEQQRVSVETVKQKLNWTEQQLRDRIASGSFDSIIMESGKQLLLNMIGESQKGGTASKKLFGPESSDKGKE